MCDRWTTSLIRPRTRSILPARAARDILEYVDSTADADGRFRYLEGCTVNDCVWYEVQCMRRYKNASSSVEVVWS